MPLEDMEPHVLAGDRGLRHMASLSCTFGGCSALRTITVDSDWALPATGVSGSLTFYNCKQLVGGNGTVFNSGKTGYAMMRVDAAGAAGYLTAG